jgi:hypothetical protein
MTPAYVSSRGGKKQEREEGFTIADVPEAQTQMSDFSSRYSGAEVRQEDSSPKRDAVQ